MPVPHPAPLSGADYSAAELSPEGDRVWLLDQRLLPERELYLDYRDAAATAAAIRDMVVRGAPAIGVAAGYGMALAARAAAAAPEPAFVAALVAAADTLRAARPTAVNLAWAVERLLRRGVALAAGSAAEREAGMAAEARALHAEDVAANRRMGALGAELLADGDTVLTHCNAGALATGGYGTALGVIRAALTQGKRLRVLADETRPYLQGARLTAWELARDGVDVTVITDSMAAVWFGRGAVQAVVVGADRVARNGDVANKVGTYGVACLARLHGARFMVAAPWSTVDLATADGAGIPIEQRPAVELTHLAGQRLVPEGVRVDNPSFDVTPARLVDALVTERGVAAPLSEATLAALATAPPSQ